MANNNCTIYEFSTSIGIQIQSDGRWVSTGFQTGWKNNTFDSSAASTIPEPVRQAIANKEFKLAESDRSPFAVIGRLVKRPGYKTWAVVAFVILGVDNRGRDVPVYRYFCCEAEKDESALASMEEILYRVVSYSHDHGELPFFNPEFFELAKCNPINRGSLDSHITLGEQQNQLISTDVKSTNLVLPKGFIENSMVAGNAYTLIKLNTFTWQRALATGQVVINQGSHRINNFAWAYNVQTLERPDSFVVIQTANQGLKEVRGSSSDGFVAGVNEQGLKAAIKAITEPQQFKVEKVIELSIILQDERLRSIKLLNKVFEDLAGRSILPNSSHPNKIKLFVLRVFLTSSATFNPFLKWFNQQDPQGGLVNIYKKFEQDFFNTIEDYSKECATLKEMVSGEICQAVLESLLVRRDISPERLCVLMQNSRWIKKQNLLDAIRKGITEVDSAIIANTAFSGAELWKPLERFIENVQQPSGVSSNTTRRFQSNSELPKWLKTILPEFITNDLAVRWREINESQKKRAEAKEQQNRLIKAEDYYRPLAELLSKLSPNTDEYPYFDYISNPQKRFPLTYSAIGDANNTGRRLFNLTIGKPISIDEAENKLLGQQIIFFFLALISVIVVPLFYLIFSIIAMVRGGLWNLLKYIGNGFVNIIRWATDWVTEGRGGSPESIRKSIKEQIVKLLSIDYSSLYYRNDVLKSIELIFQKLSKLSNTSEQVAFEVIKDVLDEIESDFANKAVHNQSDKTEKLKFFRVYFLSNDRNEISNYLNHLETLRNTVDRTVLSKTLDFQSGFRKILDSIRQDNQQNLDKRDYAEPFIKDVINFILSQIVDNDTQGDVASKQYILDWILSRRSFVSSLDFTNYITDDIRQFIKSDGSEPVFRCDLKFWEELGNSWKHFNETRKGKTVSKYQSLARFLEGLSYELLRIKYQKEYESAIYLTAYFWQISQGYVPDNVLQKFVSPQQPVPPSVYGLTLLSYAQFNDPDRPVSVANGSNTSGIQTTKYYPSNLAKPIDILTWLVLGILMIVVIGGLAFPFIKNYESRQEATPTATATVSNPPEVKSTPNLASPTTESKPDKSKLTCKVSINGEQLNLTVSNIPVKDKDIYPLMYVLNEKEKGKLELKSYLLEKEPTNNKRDLTITDLDGGGPPESGKTYYIIASTQKLPDKTADQLAKDRPIFKPTQSIGDPCYVSITP